MSKPLCKVEREREVECELGREVSRRWMHSRMIHRCASNVAAAAKPYHSYTGGQTDDIGFNLESPKSIASQATMALSVMSTVKETKNPS